MNNTKLQRIVFTSLFTALVCVSTIAIRIPTPGTGGYIHPGDALVILSGIFLGPVWGAFAGGVGSALADVLGGYFVYAPFTLIIKALSALCSGLLYYGLKGKNLKSLSPLLGGIADIIFVAGGYYLVEIPLYGAEAALISLIPNLIQGASGLVIAVILYPILCKIPVIRKLPSGTHIDRINQ